jgi:hypothetical protein
MRVPVSIRTSYFMADKKALVDSGATDNFMHPAFAKRMGLGLQKLPTPKKIFNIDNTSNKSGMITHFLDLNVQTDGTNKEMRFLVTDIGHEEILLGYPWLATFEPKFQWRSAVIDERVLPIIISSINPRSIKEQPVIATGLSEDAKRSIVRQLETECHVRSVATDLAIEAGAEQKEAILPEEYKEFARLFNDQAADRFPPAREWDHAIDLKPGAPDALDCKVYPMTRDEDTALEKFLDEMVAKGYIRPSKSPYASPFFFVKKKDGKLRPVQDYRRLNSHTVRNQYPLPLIAQLISDLSGAWIFSKVDVRQGYNNVRIKKGDEWKAAFKTKFGHWEPLVMFFGLTNSPSTFQEMMNVIYKEVIEKHARRGTTIRIYMDDIAIATTGTLQDHVDAVRDVLRVAEQNDLYFKLSKCTFHASSIDYLGVIIEKGMTRMDPVKIAGIKNWPTPTKVKDVRSFLGFCNFYRTFIRGFAHLARPLNELTRKDVEWSWETRHQKAFEELKHRVTTEPVLAHPILTDPFELEVDASGFAMGAVLLQRKEDGKKHPIAYYSKTLSAAERNYDVYDLELLAIVNALDHWRPYLAGSPHKIIIYSDHQNLLYWKEPHKISRRVAREVLMLSEYNFEIRHIKGTANGRADALSRRPDYDQGQEDNQNITVLPEQVFVRAMEVLPENTLSLTCPPMATTTSPTNTLLEPSPTPLSHTLRSFPSTPQFVSRSPSPSSTSPHSNRLPSTLPSLFLDLSQPRLPRLTSPLCSDNLGSTPLHPSLPTASGLLTKPPKRLLFRSPLPKGEGIRQALSWNREQLLDLRRLWELRRQRRIDAGLLPMAQPPNMISDNALGVENKTNTVTDIPPSSRTHPLTSPLESQCGPPFSPTAWRGLTSIVRKPQRWQVASSMPLKTTKMPLRFRQPTTKLTSLRASSQRVSALTPPSLPKGWVYVPEEVGVKVEAEVTDPSRYQMLDVPLTRSKRKALGPPEEMHPQSQPASSTIEARLSFHSVSATNTAAKRRRVTSAPTSKPLTLL